MRDASDVGVGTVLFQRDDENYEHPIAFFSYKVTSTQRNYSVKERECFAVVLVIKRFRIVVLLEPHIL